MSDNEKIVAAVNYVSGLLTYSTDLVQYNNVDYWMDPRGALYYETGDSEDFAFFVHSLLLNGSISGDRLRTYFGYKDGSPYSWVAYKRTYDNHWVILDAPEGEISDVDALPLATAETSYTSAYAYLTDSAYVVIPSGEYLNSYAVNEADIELPLFTCSGKSGAIASSSLFHLTCSATGKMGAVGSASLTLPLFTIASSGKGQILGSAAITWLMLSGLSAGYAAVSGTGTQSFSMFVLNSSGSIELFGDDYILRFTR